MKADGDGWLRSEARWFDEVDGFGRGDRFLFVDGDDEHVSPVRRRDRIKCWRITDCFVDVRDVKVGVVSNFEACMSSVVRDGDFVGV